MDLATIPLPDGVTRITVIPHAVAYPTQAGRATGIVDYSEGRCTVQCAVCLRTATARSPWAVIVANRWHHAGDDGESLLSKDPPTPYKRCPDCRAAHRHPAEQLDALAYLEEMTS